MKSQRLFIVGLVIVNLALVGISLRKENLIIEGCCADCASAAFEIVDEHGRVRGEIKVCPAQPDFKMPDGTTGYPEAVQLRLFSSQGHRTSSSGQPRTARGW